MGIFAFNTKRLIVLAAIVAVGINSFVPAGFMPDPSGHGLMICDGIHHHSSENTNIPSNNKDKHSDICPFSMGAIYSFEGVKTPLIISPVYTAIVAVTVSTKPPIISQVDFSNNVPRAPPFFS